MAREDTDAPCSCKVGRVAAEHGFGDVHADLERRWAADESVRDLATAFNRRVLRARFERSGRVPIEGEISNLYEVLTDDDVDAGSRTQARERLRQNGIDVEDLEDCFVSHQTVYRHLVDCLDVSTEPTHRTDDERVGAWRDRLLSLQTRTARVTERGLDQLRDAGAVEVGSFDVLVDVRVFCEDCGTVYPVEEFLDDRRCACERTTAGAE